MGKISKITFGLDESTSRIFQDLKKETKLNQSEIVRKAIKFYYQHRELMDEYEGEKIETYIQLLIGGEHIILDIDHWILFLTLTNELDDDDKFWADHKKVALSHAEQLPRKIQSVEGFLKRLEACNFFKLNRVHENEFTLIMSTDMTKKFIKTLLEDVFKGMGFKTEIKEDFAKLRVKVRSK